MTGHSATNWRIHCGAAFTIAARSVMLRGWEGELATTKMFRIWAQGATDQIAHRKHLAALLPHMKACTDPGFQLEFNTMTPSVTTVHALSEFRFSRAVIRAPSRPSAKIMTSSS